MLFITPEFIIFFVFVLAVISCVKIRRFQHLFLVGASYFFFYFSSNYLLSLLIFSTLLDFYIGKAIFTAKNKKRKKNLLILSLIGNLVLLGFFKYVNFGIEQINQVSNEIGISEIPALEIILPIGISFYTFQTISYTVDIYRGKLEPSNSLWEFALFVSFFPQLVAGPIERAKRLLPQLMIRRDFNYSVIKSGIPLLLSTLKISVATFVFVSLDLKNFVTSSDRSKDFSPSPLLETRISVI